jgi:hypothetical protein
MRTPMSQSEAEPQVRREISTVYAPAVQVLHEKVVALRVVVRSRHTVVDTLKLAIRGGGKRGRAPGNYVFRAAHRSGCG